MQTQYSWGMQKNVGVVWLLESLRHKLIIMSCNFSNLDNNHGISKE